jgi:threonine dehydrogenase-like Zn-dependent dehydrogenase
MKALVYTAQRKLEFLDWPDPEVESGGVLVRVRAVGVCGSDVHGWLGKSRGRTPPLILGHELAGEVAELSDPAAIKRTGGRVAVYPILGCNECRYCASGRENLCSRRRVLGLHVHGGFAEYLQVPDKNLYPLPANVDFVQGALVEPLACGLHMANLASRDQGPLAILGAGAIGLTALQAAYQMGFRKIAVVEISPFRAGMAKKLGAGLTVNPQDPTFFDVLRNFLGEEGCAVVLDAAGFSVTRQLALRLVRSGGLIVLAGLGEGETPLDCIEIVRREIRLVGSFAYNRQEFQEAVEWVAGGRLDTREWVSEAGLSDGQRLFEDLASPDSTRVKVVLKP